MSASRTCHDCIPVGHRWSCSVVAQRTMPCYSIQGGLLWQWNMASRDGCCAGFMSNRGRQNVASYLVLDCGVDWRQGADYFESVLTDYDVCSNWGNWISAAGLTVSLPSTPHCSSASAPLLGTTSREHCKGLDQPLPRVYSQFFLPSIMLYAKCTRSCVALSVSMVLC